MVPQQKPSGTIGTPLELVSNYFHLKTSNVTVYHYIINIQKLRPDSLTSEGYVPSPVTKGLEYFLKRSTPQIVADFIKKHPKIFNHNESGTNHHYVHDGAMNFYSTKKFNLPDEPIFESINIDGRSGYFEIKLTEAETINLGDVEQYYSGQSNNFPSNVLPLINLVIRFVIEKYFTANGKNYHDLHNKQRSPKIPYFEFAPGFGTTVRMAEFGLAVVFHLHTALMISSKYQTLDQYVKEILRVKNLDGLDDWHYRKATKMCHYLKFKTTHCEVERIYTVNKILNKNPYQDEFYTEDGSVLVADHFRKKYGIICARNPLVQTTTTFKDGYKVVIPLEHCVLLPNQFVHDNKIEPLVQTELLNRSKNEPNVYMDKVTQIVNRVAQIEPALLREFGLELATQPVKCNARVLPLPTVLDGEHTFHQAAQPPASWAIFCFDESVAWETLEQFVNLIMAHAKEMNLSLNKPDKMQMCSINNVKQVDNVFKNIKMLTDVTFICVVIPKENDGVNSSDLYSLIKSFCDQEHNFVCQCVNGDKIKQVPRGYINNVLDKVNGKLGGKNVVVDLGYIQDLPFRMDETMVIGIDVTHPDAYEKVHVSVAAAVGSYDTNISLYTSSNRVQLKGEIVQQLNAIMGDLLDGYYKQNNRYPKNVIVFRDGVSEAELKQLAEMELPQIRNALSKVEKNYKMACIVNIKKNSCRFSRTTPEFDGRKVSYAVPKGTVVDNFITEPIIDGQHLPNHLSQLGTFKPTKFVVLQDDFNLTFDQIEKFTFFSSYHSIRARRNTVVPTPIRYADLCAYRAKIHIHAKQTILDDDGMSICSVNSHFDAQDEDAIREHQEELIAKLNEMCKISEETRFKLYYC